MTKNRLRQLACAADAASAILPGGPVDVRHRITTRAAENPDGRPGHWPPRPALSGLQADGATDAPIRAEDGPVPLPDWMTTVGPHRAGRFGPGLLVVLAAVAVADSLLSTVLALSRL